MTNCPDASRLLQRRDEYLIHPTFVSCDQDPKHPYTFKPEFLLHRTLTIRPRESLDRCNPPAAFPYEFESWENDVRLPSNDPAAAEPAVQAYIRLVSANRTDVDQLRRPPPPDCPRLLRQSDKQADAPTAKAIRKSPYDIAVAAQCYVILELDNKMNWRFTPTAQGVTTSNYHHVDNFGLTFYDPSTDKFTLHDSNINTHVKSEDCQFLYFAVARRRFDGQKFNFHIEFEWPGDRSMPLIFDPTVPNGGGASFP